MAWKRTCDYCGRQGEISRPLGWFKVEETTPLAEGEHDQFDHENPEYDFCSADCLRDWAKDRLAMEVQK